MSHINYFRQSISSVAAYRIYGTQCTGVHFEIPFWPKVMFSTGQSISMAYEAQQFWRHHSLVVFRDEVI